MSHVDRLHMGCSVSEGNLVIAFALPPTLEMLPPSLLVYHVESIYCVSKSIASVCAIVLSQFAKLLEVFVTNSFFTNFWTSANFYIVLLKRYQHLIPGLARGNPDLW